MHNFSDLITILFACWFLTYLLHETIGGIISLFHRGVSDDHDISVKIRRIKS